MIGTSSPQNLWIRTNPERGVLQMNKLRISRWDQATWSVGSLRISNECPYKSREKTRKGEGREDRSKDWSDGGTRKQKRQEAFSLGAFRESAALPTPWFGLPVPELCEIHHTCVLNHQVCANFHGSPGNWQGISLPRNKGVKLTQKISIQILTLFLFWTGSGRVY